MHRRQNRGVISHGYPHPIVLIYIFRVLSGFAHRVQDAPPKFLECLYVYGIRLLTGVAVEVVKHVPLYKNG